MDRKPVWLVEDNPTDVYVIRNLLDGSGLDIDVHAIEHGEEALECIANEEKPCPRLVLLDLNMPRVSGLEVLQSMRASKRCARVPVIVISSSQSPADREATERLGGNAFFTKPGNLKDYGKLLDVIRKVMHEHC